MASCLQMWLARFQGNEKDRYTVESEASKFSSRTLTMERRSDIGIRLKFRNVQYWLYSLAVLKTHLLYSSKSFPLVRAMH